MNTISKAFAEPGNFLGMSGGEPVRPPAKTPNAAERLWDQILGWGQTLVGSSASPRRLKRKDYLTQAERPEQRIRRQTLTQRVTINWYGQRRYVDVRVLGGEPCLGPEYIERYYDELYGRPRWLGKLRWSDTPPVDPFQAALLKDELQARLAGAALRPHRPEGEIILGAAVSRQQRRRANRDTEKAFHGTMRHEHARARKAETAKRRREAIKRGQP